MGSRAGRLLTASPADTALAEPAPLARRSAAHRLLEGPWLPVVVFAGMAVLLFAVTRLSVAFLHFTTVPSHPFPDRRWFEGWTRWDTGWYWAIAKDGYYYAGPAQQSPVAFFPAYPLAMRAVGAVVGDVLVAGVMITFAAGLGATVVFHRWCRAALGAPVARLGVLLLVVYPFSFYLFGVVYSDALFLLAALGAFVLLEKDRPFLAGLVGAVATAARPVGVALVIGLVVRALEVRGVLPWGPPRLTGAVPSTGDGSGAAGPPAPLPRRLDLRALRPRDGGILLSAGGLVAFCTYLAWRFREPFAFSEAANAPGWSRELSLRTLGKADFFRLLEHPDLSAVHAGLALQALLTVVALLLVPAVVRRMGWGYGLYVAAVVGIPAAASKDFIGMGRYVLAAFPVFAVAAHLLVGRGQRPWLAGGVVLANGVALVVMASLFTRWYFLS